MRKYLIAFALCVTATLLLPDAASASKLYIREYKGIATVNVYQAEVAPEPGVDQTPVDFTAGAASSATFATTTHVVRLWCDVSCSVLFGPSPQTATNANAPLAGGAAEYFAVIPGQLVSVHSNP